MSVKRFVRLNYYGFEPAQYHSCRDQITEENRMSARIINHIMLVMMAGYAVLSLLNIVDRSFFPYYSICIGYTLLVEALFHVPSHRDKDPENARAAYIDISAACGGLIFFGIIASIADPHQVATAFLVMQTIIALFLNYPLFRLMLFELVCMLVFDVSSYIVKDPAIASGDVLNSFSFFMASGFLAYFFHRERIRHYLTSNHYHMMGLVDSLTGLLNHQYFFEEADRHLDAGTGEELVFAVFDIDNFKEINDKMGHRFGDHCIRAIASNMQWSLLHTSPEPCDELIEALFPEGKQAHIENRRTSCEDYYDRGGGRFEGVKALAGRVGGDEFAALVGGPDPMDRVRQIEELIRTIALPDGGTITCSVGCVRIRADQGAQAAYSKADAAMYEAKKNGRDQIRAVDAL